MTTKTAGAAAKPSQTYGAVASVYDALMRDVPHGEWLTRMERAARERGATPRSVLDVACGTGITTELLVQRGYGPVVGIDLAEAMIAVAKTKADAGGWGERAEFQVQNAATLDLGGQRFDLIVSMFDSFNYILEPEELRAAIHRLYEHTASGGVVTFDMNSVYALKENLFTQKDLTGPVKHDWVSEFYPDLGLCRVSMAFWVVDEATGQERHFSEIHWQRAYTKKEILTWLAEAGFSKIDVFGNYGNQPPVRNTDRWLFVAQRD